VGKEKATVQARALRRINPRLRVRAIAEPVEAVPLGRLRADVIIACLDSRGARQYVNQAAWRLGVPWIDTGVEGGGLLARVNVYAPGDDSPCIECAWDEGDYRLVEQNYSCAGEGLRAAPTGAPSSLGALAASLAAIECQKLVTGQSDRVLTGRQVVIDALYHKHYVTAFRRNPRCRFDHEVWAIEKLGRNAQNMTLVEALELAGREKDSWLRVESQPFVRRLTCPSCGDEKRVLRLRRSLGPRELACAACGRRMVVAGYDLTERLTACSLSEDDLGRSLESVGLRAGDVFGVGGKRDEMHYEID
jgi:adenylyltransferase/sulfurtransferase